MNTDVTLAQSADESAGKFFDMADDSRLLTYEQLSARLQVPVSTLQKHVHRREIPFLKVGKHAVRFNWKEVVAWLQKERTSYVIELIMEPGWSGGATKPLGS